MRSYISLVSGDVSSEFPFRPGECQQTVKGLSGERIELQFLEDGEPLLLPAGTQMRISVRDTPGGTLLAEQTSFTAPGAASGFYTARLSFNTGAVLALLSAYATKDSFAAVGEFAWLVPGESEWEVSDDIVFTLKRSVGEGGEPLVLASPFDWLQDSLVAGTNITLTPDDSAKTLTIASTGDVGTVTWDAITGKPSVFPPDAHTHAISEVTGLQTALDDKVGYGDFYSQLDGKAGEADLANHLADTANPHQVSAAQVGLGSVENTALSTWAGSINLTAIAPNQSISKLTNLTSNGFVKTSGGDGTLLVDTDPYLKVSEAAAGYQPLNGNLTSLASLDGASTSGVLLLSGPNTIDVIDTSFGGHGSADVAKIPLYNNNGELVLTDTLIIQDSNGLGNTATLTKPSGVDSNIMLPVGTGTLALTTDNITGTAAGLSSTLVVSSGGTGQTSFTNGQLLIGNNTGNTLSKATLTAGAGITITNGPGSITIAASIAEGQLSLSDVTTANATTSAHGLLPKLGGGTTNFLRADGTWAAPGGGGGSASTDNQLFTVDGTWTNPSPSTAKRMLVRLVGGGGGGGSGRRGAAGTVRCGGGGGAAACFVEFWALTTDFASTEAVSVGAGGTGGAVQTADDSNGNSGGTGGNTVFGDSTAKGGGGGGGGTAAAGTAGAAVSNGNYFGSTTSNSAAGVVANASGGAGNSGTAGLGLAPAGGASGGGISGTDQVANGGAGGASGNANIGLVSGGSAGLYSGTLSGGDGVSTRGGGTGGGGGASSKTTDAGNGGAGVYGSGGGGGGAALNLTGSSGAGGNGGNGYAIIITFL